MSVLTTFAGGLMVALVFGFLAHRLRLSPIVGYLAAGIVVGPFTPGFVADREVAEQFAEIGVILLMFGIGLRFHLRELFAVWKVAVPGAVIQSAISSSALAGLLVLSGWEWNSALVTGLAIAVSSTVVMATVLAEKGDLHAPAGKIAIGWTVVEDLITVVLLLLLPILFGGTAHGAASLRDAMFAISLAAVKVAGLAGGVVLLGKLVIPYALDRVVATKAHELFTLSVLTIALGIAVGASSFFGVSMALGAFLAGLAVGGSEFGARAAGDAMPMRDAFAVLFFVSVGMLFDPQSVFDAPGTIALVILAVMVVKPIVATTLVPLLGRSFPMGLVVGGALSQIGEFSFILAGVARELGLVGPDAWNALVAASLVSIALNPAIYRAMRALALRVETSRGNVTGGKDERVGHGDPMNCVLVGHGPVGRMVLGILKARGMNVSVIELNIEVVRALKSSGINAVYGEASRAATLEAAGIAAAGTLVISADMDDASEVVRSARALNPNLRVLARCRRVHETASLWRAGAEVVVAGEAEVGVALVEAVTFADELDAAATTRQRELMRERLYDTSGP